VRKSVRKLLKLGALLSALSLTACENTKEIRAGTIKQICDQWLPQSVSKKDVLTQETAAGIAGNNAANEVWCGDRPIVKELTPSRVAEAKKSGAR
jgi:hypothetical protein